MNIIVGKLGRSISFNPKIWSAIGGDNEPSLLFVNLAKHNPEHTYYMVGRSDMSRSGIDIPSNLIDVYAEFDAKTVETFSLWGSEVPNTWDYAVNWFKARPHIKLDGGILMSGPSATVAIPNKVYRVNEPGVITQPLQMSMCYAANIIEVLNEFNLPYYLITPDPRYIIRLGRDHLRTPAFALSQFNTRQKHSHFTDFERQAESRIVEYFDVVYAGIEKTFFLDKTSPEWDNEKTIKMMIVLNEGGNGGTHRGPILDEWILPYFSDIEIYGKWGTKPDGTKFYDDPRFVGPKKFSQLLPLLKSVKYTFIVPISPGWVTGKFWEMLQYGIIPFMHPDYDSQRHLPAPDFIRVKSPKELQDKIEQLEQDPALYNSIRAELKALLTHSLYEGKDQATMLMKAFNIMLEEEFYHGK